MPHAFDSAELDRTRPVRFVPMPPHRCMLEPWRNVAGELEVDENFNCCERVKESFRLSPIEVIEKRVPTMEME